MEIKPFLHEHFLLFDNYENQEATCDKCHLKINGQAYNCESCKFWLHDSCAQRKLPRKISHPAHSQHLLTRSTISDYEYPVSVCDICFTLCQGHVYICKECDFKVDLLCASDIGDETLEKESQRSDDRYKDFMHFIHNLHPLTLFNYRKVGKDEYSCRWCGKFLSGMCYGCYQCHPNFFLHQSCVLKIPFRIFEHHFHPSHPLHIQTLEYGSCCNVCNNKIRDRNAYVCLKCEFYLHVRCARLQPTLKHDVHQHSLTYIPKAKRLMRSAESDFQCYICDEDIPSGFEKGNFYRCVQCNINFHLECIPIQPTITHKYHRHDLTFIDSFIEDDSGEYYCDICEEERDPKHPIYYCKECVYIAHIHCALNKVDSKALVLKTMRQEETEKSDAESQTDHLEVR